MDHEINEKYYLKKWLPVLRTKSRLIIGIPKSRQSMDIKFRELEYQFLERLIKEGIDFNEIKSNTFYNQLYKLSMLDIKSNVFQNRNELFFDFLSIKKGLNSIITKKILILGAGAGGSSLCYLLAQTGFQNIYIVDDDIVNASEIEKTFVYRRVDIGKDKVDALKQINFDNFDQNLHIFKSKLVNEEDIESLIVEVKPDFIVKACDPNTDFRISLNNVCFRQGVPFIHMAYSFDTNVIGPLFIPGVTCCDNSLNNFTKSQFGEEHDFGQVKKLFTDYVVHPSINFNINVLANLILKEIIFFLLGKFEHLFTVGKIVYFSPLTLRGSTATLQCLKNCQFKVAK